MKSNTIKMRIFMYNLLVIIALIALVAVIFNVTIRFYIERDLVRQLSRISERTEDIALKKGPDIFIFNKNSPPAPPKIIVKKDDVFRFYISLDRSLREPLSVLNADYILLDNEKNIINSPIEWYSKTGNDVLSSISTIMNSSKDLTKEKYISFHQSGKEYIALIKPVSKKNNFGLGWIVIYSSLQKVNQLQVGINIILFIILLLSALVAVIFSSVVAKKISEPFDTMNKHIRSIAERNFGTKIDTPVYAELSEFVDSINIMSEKLETYDKAQKTFLQNASHEFRTPLMSIRSYAEGIKYNVTDSSAAADIIIDESKRLTHLVENLLYLSRLDAIEESYSFDSLNFKGLISSCVERMNIIAANNKINIISENIPEAVLINADEEKLSRAITNLLSNCIRYAKAEVKITAETTDKNMLRLTISDDGPGFGTADLRGIFDRFYKGEKGNFGLGLAITKTVIERHNGTIIAQNSDRGALFIIELPLG